MLVIAGTPSASNVNIWPKRYFWTFGFGFQSLIFCLGFVIQGIGLSLEFEDLALDLCLLVF